MAAVPKPRADAGAGLSIREVAARTGITTHTLRYYERIGLVQRVARARSGHRRYGDDDLRWLELLKKLHATEMPIRRMLEYARLVRRGDSTVAARRALLDAHRVEVEAKLARLKSTLEAIERKLGFYDRALAGEPVAAARGGVGRPVRGH
ncbi:MAG TPA: MerR family transcriptional regulator [Kofleriaceae bacterium]|jgi:DNA-binding transcriptional MerR regulator